MTVTFSYDIIINYRWGLDKYCKSCSFTILQNEGGVCQLTTIADFKKAKENFSQLIQRASKAVSTLNPVEVVTPINVTEEKKKWIDKVRKGYFVNPRFRYNRHLLEKVVSRHRMLYSIFSELDSVMPDGEAESYILDQLKKVVRDGIDTTILANSILYESDDVSMEVILRKYGLPDEENVHLANNYILSNLVRNEFEQRVVSEISMHSKAEIDFLEKKTFNAEGIKEMFDWAMLQYSMRWPIVITSDYKSIDVRDKSSVGHPVIVIPAGRKVSGLKLAELIGHEIDCHWRSSLNAFSIGLLKSDDELVYEGQAVIKDKKFNRDYRGSSNLDHAYYMAAMNEAMQSKCFARVGGTIYDLLPQSLGEKRAEKAWHYTYRVFRGITNSENANGYAFTKDRAYFEGYRLVKKMSGELAERDELDYLNFSTLDRSALEKMMNIISVDDIRNYTIPDKNVQEAFLRHIL